jgi:hypothetical protein
MTKQIQFIAILKSTQVNTLNSFFYFFLLEIKDYFYIVYLIKNRI